MSKRNKVIISASALVVVLAVVLFLVKNPDFLKKEPNLILKADTNLSQENRAFIEKRLSDSEYRYSQLPETANIIEKTQLLFVISADYRALGEYGKAKEKLELAMSLDSKNTNLMQTHSSLLAVMGDKAGALDEINKAIEIYSAETNYWLWKFDLEKELGTKGMELEGMYKEALAKTNGDLNIVTVYAQFLEGEGRKEDAIAQWQKAIELYPTNKAIYQAEIDRLKTN